MFPPVGEKRPGSSDFSTGGHLIHLVHAGVLGLSEPVGQVCSEADVHGELLVHAEGHGLGCEVGEDVLDGDISLGSCHLIAGGQSNQGQHKQEGPKIGIQVLKSGLDLRIVSGVLTSSRCF